MIEYLIWTALCIAVLSILLGILAVWEWAFGIGGKWATGSYDDDFRWN